MTPLRPTTVSLSAEAAAALAQRGAHSSRALGPHSRSTVLGRMLLSYVHLLGKTPIPGPETHMDLLCRLLPEPWTLRPSDVEILPRYVEHLPDLAETSRAMELDPQVVVRWLDELSLTQRFAIVDRLERRLAPRVAAPSAGTP